MKSYKKHQNNLEISDPALFKEKIREKKDQIHLRKESLTLRGEEFHLKCDKVLSKIKTLKGGLNDSFIKESVHPEPSPRGESARYPSNCHAYPCSLRSPRSVEMTPEMKLTLETRKKYEEELKSLQKLLLHSTIKKGINLQDDLEETCESTQSFSYMQASFIESSINDELKKYEEGIANLEKIRMKMNELDNEISKEKYSSNSVHQNNNENQFWQKLQTQSKSEIIDATRKIIQQKNCEIEDLKSRIKEKDNFITSNIQIMTQLPKNSLTKFEELSTILESKQQEIDQLKNSNQSLTEEYSLQQLAVSAYQEQMDFLTKDENYELEKISDFFNQQSIKLKSDIENALSEKNQKLESLVQLFEKCIPQMNDVKQKLANSQLEHSKLRDQIRSLELLCEEQKNIASQYYQTYEELKKTSEDKIRSLELLCEEHKRIATQNLQDHEELKKICQDKVFSLELRCDDQKNIAAHHSHAYEDLKKMSERQLLKQKNQYELIFTQLTQEIHKLKNGEISDL